MLSLTLSFSHSGFPYPSFAPHFLQLLHLVLDIHSHSFPPHTYGFPPGFNPLGFSSPSLSFPPAILESKRNELDKYGIVTIVDSLDFSLKTRLRSLWRLDFPFTISGKIGNYFLFKFRSQEDMGFVVDKGLWSIDNSFLVVDRLQPNMALQAL